jgi:3-phosphoshikimate 1-carboxyvinyltransferase
MAAGLRAMGADLDERPDGISVNGPVRLRGAVIDPRGDHRIAMAFGVAGLVADGPTSINEAEAAAVSYPAFFRDLQEVSHAA